jgi:hypothetical protein
MGIQARRADLRSALHDAAGECGVDSYGAEVGDRAAILFRESRLIWFKAGRACMPAGEGPHRAVSPGAGSGIPPVGRRIPDR